MAFLGGAVSLLLALPAGAAPSQSNTWNRSPSWSQGNQGTSSENRKSNYRAVDRTSESEISPFSPDSNNLALDVGQVFLMGDLGERYQNNLGMQLHYTYGVSEVFGFDSSFGYSGHSDGKYSLTTLLAGLRTNLTWYDKIIPYATAGLGFYKPSIRIDEFTSASPVMFGLHLGAGATLALTDQIFFGASLTFHDMFGSREETPRGPVEVTGTYTTFYLNAGVSF